MKELIDYIVRSLVDVPEEVSIRETVGESVLILEIFVAQDDIGKVIGREGRIANAIRTIAKASAAKTGKKVTVEIMTHSEAQEPAVATKEAF